MCNPGGAAALLGFQEDMRNMCDGLTKQDFVTISGREMGVVRISLGLASNFQDIWKIIKFAATIADQESRHKLLTRWTKASAAGSRH
jgi:molybdenum cofactor sulfurtransferase